MVKSLVDEGDSISGYASLAKEIKDMGKYPDKGCQHYRKCRTCIFEICIEDISLKRYNLMQRDAEIIRLFYASQPVGDISTLFHLYRQNIYKIISQYKENCRNLHLLVCVDNLNKIVANFLQIYRWKYYKRGRN
jgi:hypothetical protein